MVLLSICCDMWLCRLGTTIGDLKSQTYSIGQRFQIMVVIMLQNWNHWYFIHYRIIKYLGFKPITYAINLNAVSSSKIFNGFDFMFL